MAKKPKSNSIDAYGILNPYGDIWTPHWFATESQAAEYIQQFWSRTIGKDKADLARFKVVPVRVSVSALPPPPENVNG